MKNINLYKIPIIYMLIYVILILISGVWLFFLSQENIIISPADKSLHNLVEVATPHLFAIGIVIFVVAHFLLFSTKIKQKNALKLSIWLYIFALLNIGSYFLISIGWFVLGWIKILSLFGFLLLFILLLLSVWLSL